MLLVLKTNRSLNIIVAFKLLCSASLLQKVPFQSIFLFQADICGYGNTTDVTYILCTWAQLGGGHGGRVPHFFRRWGNNKPCPPTFLSLAFVFEEVSCVKSFSSEMVHAHS